MTTGNVNVLDVAAYVLSKIGSITTLKLQKLVYYAQAWSLVWDEKPLFSDEIEAWANGPVSPRLYRAHRGEFKVRSIDKGDKRKLSQTQQDVIKAVLDFYGDKTSQWLSDLTHAEEPWINARKGLLPSQRGDNVITHSAMFEYYSSLT